ncbi:MAG: tetratricopeptide repeat-containing sensor histidine kinase [Bacteroidota bacterium]
MRSFLMYRQSQYGVALSLLNSIDFTDNSRFSKWVQACVAAVSGTCHRSLGQREEALSAFHNVFEQFQKIPESAFQRYLHDLSVYHIAEINAELGDFVKMLETHHLFLELGTSSNNKDMINRALNGIGRAYLGMKDYDNCLKYLYLAEKASLQGGNLPFAARNLHDMGSVYYSMKAYENALEYFDKALEIREENKLSAAAITTHLAKSKVYLAQANLPAAIAALLKAKTIAEELKILKKLYSIYEQLSIVYEKNEQYELALAYYRKFHKTKEIIDDVNNTQKENERVREANTELLKQKEIITEQKLQIEEYTSKLIDNNIHLQNFAFIAAHDLKTPIRSTSMFIGLLLRKHRLDWDESDVEYLNFITQNMANLTKMIDDLLSLSKLDQDLPPPEVVDLNELLIEIQNRLQTKIKEVQPTIIIQKSLPSVLGHESLTGLIFQNLIDNAIKYRSDSQSKIQILFEPFESCEKQQYIQFEVRDNGQGIPDDLQDSIFELFSRANHQNSNGIGLATCKKIVSNYGGKIWVKSRERIGTSVFFTLPAGG